jgi:hypothetical protein
MEIDEWSRKDKGETRSKDAKFKAQTAKSKSKTFPTGYATDVIASPA